MEYVNQSSNFTSNVDRFKVAAKKAPPMTKYQPESFTDKLVRKIDTQKAKKNFIQEKKYYEQRAKEELKELSR